MSAARTHTVAALIALLRHVEEMAEVVQYAMAGDRDALDTILTDYGCQYPRMQSLCREVSGAMQWDDDEEFERIAAEEDALRTCKGERA